MLVKVEKKPKATLELTIIVEKDKVKQSYDDLFKEVVKDAEIKGFRKGQAPQDLVKEKADVSKLYGEVINKLLQTYYPQALKQNLINPIANPKVEIKEFDLEKDFEFKATVAVFPEVKIGDYKKELEKIKNEKNAEVRKQNAERLKKGEKLVGNHSHLTADDVLEALLRVIEVEIAEILIEDETERLLSRLVNQAQAIGLSLEQYLKTQNKTADDLKADYTKIAERNLKAEFALSKLIDQEKVEVSDEEIDAMITAGGDEKMKELLNNPAERLYIKSILAKNKVITKIIKDVEGSHDNNHENQAQSRGNDHSESLKEA